MKKLHIIGVAAFVVFAFSVVAVSAASAAPVFLPAEWLVNGKPITATLSVNSTGELLLEDQKTPLGKSDILCSGVLHGTIGAGGKDEITELLSLTGEAISLTAKSGTALVCEGQAVCEEPLVWAVHLPWKTELELMEEEGVIYYVDLIVNSGAGEPGWAVECMKTILKPTDECVAEQGINQVTTEAENLDATFTEALTLLAGLPLATCSLEKKATGNVEGLGTIVLTETGQGPLTASSE